MGQSTEQLDAQSRLRENVHGRVFLYLDVVLRSLRGPVDEAGLWFDRTVVEQWKANFLALRGQWMADYTTLEFADASVIVRSTGRELARLEKLKGA